jgi:hypothetical protein
MSVRCLHLQVSLIFTSDPYTMAGQISRQSILFLYTYMPNSDTNNLPKPVPGNLYIYIPNKGAPIFFTIAFAISAAGHIWQCL